MLDKVGGEDSADRVEAAKEGSGNSVKAHTGNGRTGDLPLLKVCKVEERGTEPGKSTGNHKGKNNVAFFSHAAVFGGILIITGGLEFITELCFVENDGNGNRHKNRERNGKRNTRVASKEIFQAKSREKGFGVGDIDMEGIGACGFFYTGKQHIGAVEADPVEHDAGDDFIDIAVGFEQADDGSEECAGEHCKEHAGQPAPTKLQSGIKGGADADGILAGNTDIEKADLIREEDGKSAHKKRCGFDEGSTEVLQLKLGAGIRHEVLHNGDNCIPGTGGVDEEKNDVTD